MVVVKRLDPNYPRMGYEVQKGLLIDMPRGDGKADIIKDQLPPTEVGGLFLSSVVERLKADSLPKDSVL